MSEADKTADDAASEETRASSRTSKQTQKGLDYALNLAENSYKTLVKRIEKDLNKAQEILHTTGTNDPTLLTIADGLSNKFGELHNVTLKLRSLWTDSTAIQNMNREVEQLREAERNIQAQILNKGQKKQMWWIRKYN